MSNNAILFILLSVIFHYTKGQSPESDHRPEEAGSLEKLVVGSESTFNTNDLSQIIDLIENPIDLNKATKEDLQSINQLNNAQIDFFFDYLSRHGKLLSIYELQAIPDWDLTTIQRVIPYVYVDQYRTNSRSSSFFQRFKASKNNYLVLRLGKTLETKTGFKRDDEQARRYAGSSLQWLAKYRASASKDFSLGFTLEKDAGENFTLDKPSNQFGIDYLSWHIQFKNRGRFKDIIIGDYNLQFGQGLLLAAGFNPGKSTINLLQTKRNHLGILPHTSSVEYGFLHGIASTIELKNIQATLFFSHKKIDSEIKFDSATNNLKIYSIKNTGLHRTDIEKAQFKNASETIAGFNLLKKSRSKNFQYGVSAMLQNLEYNSRKSPRLYKRFEKTNNPILFFQSQFDLTLGNVALFGEILSTQPNEASFLLGSFINFSNHFYGTIIYRNYKPGLNSRYGNAFGEFSNNENESGIFWGMQYKASKYTRITTYLDIFKNPWLKFKTDRPGVGFEYVVGLNHNIKGIGDIRLSYKKERKSINYQGINQNLSTISEQLKTNYLIQWRYHTYKLLVFQSNIQFSEVKLREDKSAGFSISQDIIVDMKPFRFSSRIVLFETTGFENRHYRYERDVLYTLSIPALSGNGIRYYGLLQMKIGRNLIFWLKYARTRYFDRDFIGNSAEKINRPYKSDIRFQIKFNFH